VKIGAIDRVGAWLAGAWAGVMIGLGVIAAPVLFALLPRADAGRVAARLFSLDATIGIVVGAVLMLIGLQIGRDRAERTQGSRFSLEFALALAALLCIVIGYYALLPMIEEARAGRGALSFGTLHAIASAFFVVRLAIAAVLAWRLSPPR
jgi:hypothetical protein